VHKKKKKKNLFGVSSAEKRDKTTKDLKNCIVYYI